MLRVSVLLIIALSLMLAACGSSGKKAPTVSSSPGPTGASGPRSVRKVPSEGSTSVPAIRGAGGFDTRTVKVSFLEKSLFGAKSQVVYLVANPNPSPLAQAKACVQRYLSRAPSAYCFAFASERAIKYSKITRRPRSTMGRPCWIAYWGKPSGRRPFGSGTNPAAQPLHCPGATG